MLIYQYNSTSTCGTYLHKGENSQHKDYAQVVISNQPSSYGQLILQSEAGNYNKTLRTNLRDVSEDFKSSEMGGGLSGRV